MQKVKETLGLVREFLYVVILLAAVISLVKGCNDQVNLRNDNTALMNFVRAHNYITEHESVPASQEEQVKE